MGGAGIIVHAVDLNTRKYTGLGHFVLFAHLFSRVYILASGQLLATMGFVVKIVYVAEVNVQFATLVLLHLLDPLILFMGVDTLMGGRKRGIMLFGDNIAARIALAAWVLASIVVLSEMMNLQIRQHLCIKFLLSLLKKFLRILLRHQVLNHEDVVIILFGPEVFRVQR